MTISNLAIWNKVECTDPEYTKAFNRGGGFKGTSTNMTYLVKKATNLFGPIGIGWGYEVLSEEVMVGHDASRVHKIHLKFWYKWEGERGEFSHFGQTDFVGKNKNGYFTDEEAPKKSLTDALSKCMSMLGFAADVHMGWYDDNKYVNNIRDRFDGDVEFKEDGLGKQNDAKAQDEPPQKPDQPAARLRTPEEIEDGANKRIDDAKTVIEVMDLMTNAKTIEVLDRLGDAVKGRVEGRARDRIEKLAREVIDGADKPNIIAAFMTKKENLAAVDALGAERSERVKQHGREKMTSMQGGAKRASRAKDSDKGDGAPA